MSCGIEGPYTKYSQILFTGQKIHTVTRKSCCYGRYSTITTDDLIALKLVTIISHLPVNSTFSKFSLGCYSPNIEIFSSISAFSISVVPTSDHLEAFKTRLIYLSTIVSDSVGLGWGPRNSISKKFPGDALSYWSRSPPSPSCLLKSTLLFHELHGWRDYAYIFPILPPVCCMYMT